MLRPNSSLCMRLRNGCNRLGSMVDPAPEAESTELTISRTTDSTTPPTKRGSITSKHSTESTSNETQTGEAGKPLSSEKGDPVSFNVIMETALFRSTSSFLSTAVTDESVVVCLEVWKRMERCLLARPPSETYVASTDCPWSTRMMIKLNAMPCEETFDPCQPLQGSEDGIMRERTIIWTICMNTFHQHVRIIINGGRRRGEAHAIGDAILCVIRREVHGEEDNNPD